MSLHSNHSRSPNLTTTTTTAAASSSPAASPSSIKQLPTNNYLNNRINSSSNSPKLSGTSCHNHSGSEAVPRTHSSNKRLRKDDLVTNISSIYQNNKTQADELKESLAVYNNEPLFKKQRINGENININKNINSKVPSPLITQELINHNSEDKIIPNNDNVVADSTTAAATTTAAAAPKKRGRKKGSKAIKNQLQHDGVKEKIESMTRNPKVKKTSEILADLQAASKLSSVALAAAASNLSTGTKLNSQSSTVDDDEDDNDDNNLTSIGRKSSRITKLKTNINETNERSSNTDINSRHETTVEEIMSKLPPLDIDSIRWSDDEYDAYDGKSSPQSLPPVTEEDIQRLQKYCIEGLNGNFQLRLTDCKDVVQDNDDNDNNCKIDNNDKKQKYLKRLGDEENDERQFHEWHEMLARPTCDDQILHILPYVIID